MKKRIIKSYISINFPSEDEFARWKKTLKSVAKKNNIRRRTRRQQRIDRKEKLRLEIRAKRDAAKSAEERNAGKRRCRDKKEK